MKQNVLVYGLGIILIIVLGIIVFQMVQISSLNKELIEEKSKPLPEPETVVEYIETEPEIVVQNVGFEEEPVLELSKNALKYIRFKGGSCISQPSEISKVTSCLVELMTEKTPVMKEVDFVNYEPFSETKGKIIFENVGLYSADGALFTLEMNSQVVDEGCLQPGTVKVGDRCVLNFDEICIIGDILELFYDGESLMFKHC